MAWYVLAALAAIGVAQVALAKWLRRPRGVPVWVEPDPVVRVGPARMRSWVDRRGRELPPDRLDEGAMVELGDQLVLECSRCGVLHETERPGDRYSFQLLARQHANEAHDGLVGAEGWAR